jgi:hypothetical protein
VVSTVAIALALLIAFGPPLPTVLAGAYLSSFLNYGQKLDSISDGDNLLFGGAGHKEMDCRRPQTAHDE